MKLKFNITEIMSRSFDLVNLPSEGKYYENKVSSLKIRHLTGLEEMLLTSYFLNETGDALLLSLENLIIDEFDIKKLIMSDLQGIMIFLYATAYGDKLKNDIKCPVCGYNDEVNTPLSSLKFKVPQNEPQDGKFYLYMFYEDIYSTYGFSSTEENGKLYLEVIIQPQTFGQQLENIKNNIKGNKSTDKVTSNIVSIGGVENRNVINKFIKSLKLQTFKKIKEFIKNNEVGIEEQFKHTCLSCNQESSYPMRLGHDFLKLPESHRQTVLDECFVLSHYSQGSMALDKVKEMPTTERRWAINRLQEELQKKQDAEKKAAENSAARSRAKKKN